VPFSPSSSSLSTEEIVAMSERAVVQLGRGDAPFSKADLVQVAFALKYFRGSVIDARQRYAELECLTINILRMQIRRSAWTPPA